MSDSLVHPVLLKSVFSHSISYPTINTLIPTKCRVLLERILREKYWRKTRLIPVATPRATQGVPRNTLTWKKKKKTWIFFLNFLYLLCIRKTLNHKIRKTLKLKKKKKIYIYIYMFYFQAKKNQKKPPKKNCNRAKPTPWPEKTKLEFFLFNFLCLLCIRNILNHKIRNIFKLKKKYIYIYICSTFKQKKKTKNPKKKILQQSQAHNNPNRLQRPRILKKKKKDQCLIPKRSKSKITKGFINLKKKKIH